MPIQNLLSLSTVFNQVYKVEVNICKAVVVVFNNRQFGTCVAPGIKL